MDMARDSGGPVPFLTSLEAPLGKGFGPCASRVDILTCVGSCGRGSFAFPRSDPRQPAGERSKERLSLQLRSTGYMSLKKRLIQ